MQDQETVPPPGPAPEIPRLLPDHEQHHAAERRYWCCQTVIGSVALVASIVAAIGAWLAFSQTKRQANYAQRQLDVALNEQRPWISVSPELDSPITYDTQGGAHFKVRFPLKNTGHLPAINVRPKVDRDLITFGTKYDTESALRKLCASDDKIQPIWLFPTDPFPYWETLNFSAAEVVEGRLQKGGPKNGTIVPGILPVINICVDYSVAYDKAFKGETAFSFQLVLQHGVNDVGFSYIPVDRTVQPNEILVMPNISEGSFLQ